MAESFIILDDPWRKLSMRKYRSFLKGVMILALIFAWGLGVSHSEERLHQFTMENGMKLILKENHNAPVVALQVWVKVGSGDEGDEEAGMCHFIEHMLFKGTAKRKVGGLAREVESLGGAINAYTSLDQTVYHVILASRYADIGLDVLSDAIQHSTFRPLELDREREVILEEIRRGQDDPSRVLFQQTSAVLYQKHPYRRPIIGFEKVIRKISRDQMISFYKKWYTPDRMVFVAVGNFNLLEMEKKVRGTFQGFDPSPERVSLRVEEPEQTEFRSVISFGHFKETYLQIAFPIPSGTHVDTPPLDALSHILTGGEASRLIQKVKLEKGLVHSISASSHTPRDPGSFIIRATLLPENIEEAIKVILSELIRLRNEGVTPDELHRVKVSVESDLIYDRQTVQGQARKLGYYEAVTGDIHFEKEYVKRIGLLQSQDIQYVLEKYFKASRMVVSLLAPHEKKDLLNVLSLKHIVSQSELGKPLVQKGKEVPIYKTVIDNGIRLLIKENRVNPIVTIQASFLAGVRWEEESKNGINHFMSVMVTKGTKNLTPVQITKKVERMAGTLSGFSGYNSFGLTLTCLSQHIEEAFQLLAEVLKEPSFDPEEMEKRRRLILASIRQQEDYPDRLVFKLFRKTLYQQHPYRMDTSGTLDSIQKLTQKDLKEYYQKVIVPENMVLTVVGDVDTGQVVQIVKKELGDLKGGPPFSSPLPKEPPLDKTRRVEIEKTKEQAHFVLGFLGTTLQHKDRYALEVLDAALSGMGGRLFYELRDKESLAYALAFINHMNVDPGYLGVYMGTHPDKLETAIAGVVRELKKVKEEGLKEDEVERAKRYLIGNFEIGLQTNGAQANQISLDELYGLGFDHHQRYPQEIEKVTIEEVNRVAKRYLNLDAYALAIIRPSAEKKE
jgi:zinc protease